jgi:hypothetical protein
MMQATGFADAERVILGAKVTDSALHARLAPQLPIFTRMFGSQAGQPDEFQATLDQTLFLKHNPAIRALLGVRTGCLLDRLGKLSQSNEIADELFISVFSRPATVDEKNDIAALLKEAKNPNDLLSEAIWAMIASAEFRFNH